MPQSNEIQCEAMKFHPLLFHNFTNYTKSVLVGVSRRPSRDSPSLRRSIMLTLWATGLRKASRKAPGAIHRSSARSSRPASLSRVYGAMNQKSSQSRSFLTSRKLYSESNHVAGDSENSVEAAGENEFDFTMLQPKLQAKSATKAANKSSARTYTDAQRQRSAKAMQKLQNRISKAPNQIAGPNEEIMAQIEAGNDAEVLEIWKARHDGSFPLSMSGFCAILISLSRLEDSGLAVDIQPVINEVYLSQKGPTPLIHLILLEHYTKAQDYARARREFLSLVEVTNSKYEELQEQIELLEDGKMEIPANLKSQFHGLHEYVQFSSMNDFLGAIEYYALVVSSAEGTVGPLTRKRTIDSMAKQWNSTEVGKMLPFTDSDTMLSNEAEIISKFLD